MAARAAPAPGMHSWRRIRDVQPEAAAAAGGRVFCTACLFVPPPMLMIDGPDCPFTLPDDEPAAPIHNRPGAATITGSAGRPIRT